MFGEYFRVFPSIWLWFEPLASTSAQKITISNFEQARTHTFPSGNERALSDSNFDTTLVDFCLQIVSELETLNNTPRMLLCVAGKHLVTWPNTWINSETHCTIVIISNSLGGALLYSYNHNWSHRETDHFGSCFCRSFDIIFCWFVLTWQKQPIYRQNFALKLAHCFWKCKIGHFEIKMHSCIINMY